MRVDEKFTKKLLVEGNDDQHVIWALCEHFKINETFDIIDAEGIDKLLVQIPIRFKQTDIDTIGIIIDADTDLKSRWNNLKQIFSDQGIPLPVELPAEGLIVKESGSITIGIWIMPNNNVNGMLEDFIAFLVPNDDKLLPIIKDNLNIIESKQLNQYKPIHKSKAVIHSWLAIQEDPGTPMGLGITKRYLTTEEEVCLNLVNWLNRLFNNYS
jgi:hypothetical protein